MSLNLSDELKRDRRAALRLYSASLMSNTKWRAVFSTLEDERLAIRQLVAKFVDVVEAKPMGLPLLHGPDASVDSFEFGPLPLVGIEWIEVPAVAIFPRGNGNPAERYTQDIRRVRSALVAVGKCLPIYDTETGLRIIGHVR